MFKTLTTIFLGRANRIEEALEADNAVLIIEQKVREAEAGHAMANCGIDLSKIEWLLVTPKYHHWHHADAPEAINKNYAVYLSFIDKLFGTQYNPKNWPEGYGVIDGEPPKTLFRQQLHPFTG